MKGSVQLTLMQLDMGGEVEGVKHKFSLWKDLLTVHKYVSAVKEFRVFVEKSIPALG